ncbi:hypothetical protein PanWU01x14_096240 [Parasponia andersonii]|uniref:Uncharacterized protein n=1 Tax=Parasponia andersonii TaxID=3476 RepID=A0A2P5D4R5_PARAD|nr:hypothetical protein PanWU01x14_096240 [Parasponia andersonii]
MNGTHHDLIIYRVECNLEHGRAALLLVPDHRADCNLEYDRDTLSLALDRQADSDLEYGCDAYFGPNHQPTAPGDFGWS